MDKTVNTVYNLSKCAEGHELDDLDLRHVANGVLVGEQRPWVGLGILVAERDLALVLIEVDNINLYLVTDGEDLRGLVDAAPAQLRDMDHTVNAADIDECAVAGEGLDNALVLLADLDLVPDGLSALTALSLRDTADGADNALASLVDLSDLEADSLLEEPRQIGLTREIGLRGGNEHAHALDHDDNAALVLFGDNAFENGAVVNCGLDVIPHLRRVETLLGELCGTLNVIDSDNNSLDGVADLDNVFDLDAVVGKLGRGDEAGVLGAEIDADLSAGDRNDNASYLISIIYSFESFLQHFVKGFFILKLGFFNFDFVRHFVSYLLNYPRRRRRPCREANDSRRFQSAHVQLVQPFYKLDIAAAFRT